MGQSAKIKKIFFITGTDTGVGKTMFTLTLGILLQEKGFDVGVMKPVQCGGSDSAFLKKHLGVDDSLEKINPYFALEPLSPYLAFKRCRKEIRVEKIIDVANELRARHDVLLIEGAGGVLVPIKKGYLVADLIRDLDCEVIVVSRLGLGTINHSLLTINQLKGQGSRVKGIGFNCLHSGKMGIAEETNPAAIKELTGVAVLGTIPFLKEISRREIVKKCAGALDVKKILESGAAPLSYEEWDKKYIWHPFTQMQDWQKEEPLIIEEARGSYLKDTKGRWYIDGVSSLWVNVHGHRKRAIDDAIKNQIDKVSHSTLLGLGNTPSVELAKELVSIAPKGLQKVFYSDSGSTAVEIALKIAYQYWQNIGRAQKRNIVHFEHSYHGDTLGSVSVGGIDLFQKVYRDLIFKAIKVDSPYGFPILKGMSRAEYAFARLKNFENVLAKKNKTIAAVIVEPLVQAAAGILVWPMGILKRVAELCRQYDCLLIADEVATGFGRTGKMFACKHEKVSPDILCLAKGLTGGYLPLAATLTTQRIFDGFLFPYKDQKTFFHGHTYTGNPLACAAALANLKVFEKEKTLYNLPPKIRLLTDELRRFRRLAHVGDVRQKGFMAGIELVRTKDPYEHYPWEEKMGARVCQELRKHGVILRPLGNVIVLMPPLAIKQNELKRMSDITYRIIEKITKRDKG